MREYHHRVKIEVLSVYSGGDPKCSCCGEANLPFLGIDHIVPYSKSPGAVKGERRRGTNYHNLKKEKYPPGYQVLCHNCNQAKRTYDVCPVH